MSQPDPFLDGFRLIDGTNLNEALANPEWSVSQNPNATAGGTVTTSRKVVDTITDITVASAPNSGISLPTALPGRVLLVMNNTLVQLVVYAEGGSTIDGIPGSIGVHLSPAAAVMFTATEVGNWIKMPFVALNANQTELRVLTNITTLRAQTLPAVEAPAQVSLIYNTVVNDGGGIFYLDAADHVTPDNGTTVIVDLAGNRWKRELVQAAYIAFTPTGVLTSSTVQGAIAEVMTKLAASSGSSLVGFIQAGTGAVARTAQAKMRDVINVRDFGALGDGSDQTTAFQNAFNAAGVNGKVVIPSGSYKMSAQINCPSNIVIEGAGPNQTLIYRDTDYGNTFYFSNAGAAQIRGIWFWHGLPYNSYETSQYVANTGATSGYPGDGKIIWDNAAQTTSANVLIAEKTNGGVNNQYLALLYVGQEFLIKDAANENNYQKWTVSGAPTNVNPGSATSYWNVPVTIAYDAGTGTTNFANGLLMDLQTGALPNRVTTGSHLYFGNLQNTTVEDCWMWRMQFSIAVATGSLLRINRCNMQGCWNQWNTNGQEMSACLGIGLVTYTQLVEVTDCYFGGSDAGNQKLTYTSSDTGVHTLYQLHNDGGGASGILVYTCEGLLVTGCYLGGNAYANIQFAPSGILSQVRIHNNFFDGSNPYGSLINITPTVDGAAVGQLVLSDNTFNTEMYSVNCFTTSNPFGGSVNNVMFDFVMSGNSFSNSVGTPVLLRRVAGGVIGDNIFTGYNARGFTNGADINYGYGIYIDNSKSVTIDGNIFGGGVNQATPGSGYPINTVSADPTVNVNVVEKNSVWNGVGAAVSLVGRVDKAITTKTANYVMFGTEYIVVMNAAAPVTVTLPSNMATGYTCNIKDISGNASTNNITIIGTIDGVANYLLSSNYQSVELVYNGASWNVVSDGRDLISNATTQGVGFGVGAGGVVTQLTSRTTPVSLNAMSGAITLFSAAGATAAATFTVNNTSVNATDTIILNQKSGTDKYVLLVTAVAANSFDITFYTTGGTTVEQPVFNFSVIKGSAS